MKKRKSGQLTLFIIVAVAVVGLIIGGFFIYKSRVSIPTRFQPIEEYFLSCIESRLQEGVSLLEEKGGRISEIQFEPGSQAYPTSSHLGFMGDSIPYWYYISGNGLERESVPTVNDMEKDLSDYITETLPLCDFGPYIDRGFDVSLEVKSANVDVQESKVSATVRADLLMSFEDERVSVSTHEKELETKLGRFYQIATDIYNREQQTTFLENFTIDTMYLYLPTNDAELTCSPKTWTLTNISSEFRTALESNLLFLSPNAKEKYFRLPFSTDEDIRFLYMQDWPTKVFTPNDNGILVAEPAGNQPGLGLLGFCITSYHFVYEIVHPVMIQIYDEREFFQFPVNVVIKGNKPREALPTEAYNLDKQSVCQYKNTKGLVYTYDANLNPLEADIKFKCFTESCNIGSTEIIGSDAVLEEMFPQCMNGFVIARAEGYIEAKEQVNSIQEFESGLILKKLYDLEVKLNVDGKASNTNAIVYFESDNNRQVAYLPDQTTVSLAEGYYNVSVTVYSNAQITIPESKTNKCVQVPQPGIGGVLGLTNEQCFDMTIPEQKISNAIVGGGKSEEYFLESQLQTSNTIELYVSDTEVPKTIEDVSRIYAQIEGQEITVALR